MMWCVRRQCLGVAASITRTSADCCDHLEPHPRNQTHVDNVTIAAVDVECRHYLLTLGSLFTIYVFRHNAKLLSQIVSRQARSLHISTAQVERYLTFS